MHGDLKEENVIVTDRGPVLIDFGVARTADDPRDARNEYHGTMLFIAPETVTHGISGPERDIFALGIMLYRYLVGSTPWDGQTIEEVLLSISRGPSEEALGRLDDEPALRELVRSMIQRRPEDRTTIEQVIAQLERVLAGGHAKIRQPVTAPVAAAPW